MIPNWLHVLAIFMLLTGLACALAIAVWVAIRADTLSLIAWQAGMYGFMAVAYFAILRNTLGVDLKANTAEFWFAMQVAMLCGLATAYPVNWWLLRAGFKEAM